MAQYLTQVLHAEHVKTKSSSLKWLTCSVEKKKKETLKNKSDPLESIITPISSQNRTDLHSHCHLEWNYVRSL